MHRHDGDHEETYSAITVEYVKTVGQKAETKMFTVLAHRRVSLSQAHTLCQFVVTVDGVRHRSTVRGCNYCVNKQKLLAETPWEVVPLQYFLKRIRPTE